MAETLDANEVVEEDKIIAAMIGSSSAFIMYLERDKVSGIYNGNTSRKAESDRIGNQIDDLQTQQNGYVASTGILTREGHSGAVNVLWEEVIKTGAQIEALEEARPNYNEAWATLESGGLVVGAALVLGGLAYKIHDLVTRRLN